MQPKCECFDPTDASPGCSDSLLPNGDFLDDATDLFDDIEEAFFDSLIAVFVDHPDKWTTSSWAWAAGLLTVFLIMLLCICSTFWPRNEKSKDYEMYPRPAASRNGSSSRGSSPRKESSSPRKTASPRGRSVSSQQLPSPKSAAGTHMSALRASSAQRRSTSSGPRQDSSHRRTAGEGSRSNRQSPTYSEGVPGFSTTNRESAPSRHRHATSPEKQSPSSPIDGHGEVPSRPRHAATSSGGYYGQSSPSSTTSAEM
jgi:hypothetical protein